MKNIALLSAAAIAMATAAFAAEEMKAASATTPAPATAAPSAAAPAATGTMTASKKVEMKDGSWAEIGADGSVKISKDGGQTWTPAPDGTWEAKDGTKITTKGGVKASM